MLTFAITTLFALSFFGALAVIGYMFASYRGKIASVIRQELQLPSPEPVAGESVQTFRVRSIRITGTAIKTQRHSRRPAPLAAAA